MRVVLKGIHRVKVKIADGSAVTYYYAWRGGPRIKAEPGSVKFMQLFDAAISERRLPAEGTVFKLIADYKSSSEFTSKKPNTRRGYLTYLKLIEEEFGDMPIAALQQPEVRGVFKRWRDGMAENPRKADYAWTTLARIFAVAKDHGTIRVNPCERGGRLYEADRTDNIWEEAAIGRMLNVSPLEIQTALLLALWTGQRQGDLLKLPWSAYDGTHIRLRQSKAGRRMVIPVGKTLKAHLDGLTKKGTLILNNTFGRPWTEDGFRTSWGKWFGKSGINEDLHFHDLRGSAVVRLAVAGATVPEIATFTGHSLKGVEGILDAHYLGRDVRLADSAMLKVEENIERSRPVK